MFVTIKYAHCLQALDTPEVTYWEWGVAQPPPCSVTTPFLSSVASTNKTRIDTPGNYRVVSLQHHKAWTEVHPASSPMSKGRVQILIRKIWREEIAGRPRHRWQESIKIILILNKLDVGWLSWLRSSGELLWKGLRTSGSMKGGTDNGEFIEQLIDCQILKKDSPPWTS
jgi:hypothetical protein